MLAAGSPRKAARSAILPGSIRPTSSPTRSASAVSAVLARIALHVSHPSHSWNDHAFAPELAWSEFGMPMSSPAVKRTPASLMPMIVSMCSSSVIVTCCTDHGFVGTMFSSRARASSPRRWCPIVGSTHCPFSAICSATRGSNASFFAGSASSHRACIR